MAVGLAAVASSIRVFVSLPCFSGNAVTNTFFFLLLLGIREGDLPS